MTRLSDRGVLAAGFLAALVVAVVVAQFASSEPDGLEFVAEQEGFAETATDHALDDAPLAGYGEDVSESGWLNTAVAGAAGVVVTLALGYGIFWLARRTNRRRPASGAG